MLTSFRFIALLGASVLLSWITAAAQTSSETRSLSSFNQIDVSGGYEQLILQEGSSESIAIEASGVALSDIETEVKGNALQIKMKKGSYKNTKIKLTVTYRSLEEINNSGSTDIVLRSTIKGKEFELNSSGSGDFTGAFDVKDLDINISGSSNVTLTGSADKQEYAISGSGDIKAAGLKGASADVAISGSGDVELNVSGPVQTAVSGSGKVRNNKQ